MADIYLSAAEGPGMDKVKLFPDGIVPFILTSKFSEEEIDRISRVMKHISQNCNVKYIDQTNEEHYLEIKKGDGCYFCKGCSPNLVISLDIGCFDFGIILHELLHALGFKHEHQRSDRDEYVQIFPENITEGEKDQFKKLKIEEYIWSNMPFDYESIMMYDSYAFSNNRKPTMLHINGTDLERKNRLSEMDKKKLVALYGRNETR